MFFSEQKPIHFLFQYVASHMSYVQKRRLRGCVCPAAESINVSLAPEVFFKYHVNRIQKSFNQIAHIYSKFPAISLPKWFEHLRFSAFSSSQLFSHSVCCWCSQRIVRNHIHSNSRLFLSAPLKPSPSFFRLLWRNLKRIGSIASPAYMRGIWKGVGCVWSFLFLLIAPVWPRVFSFQNVNFCCL